MTTSPVSACGSPRQSFVPARRWLVSITLAIAAGALALGAGSALGQFKAHRNAPDIPGSAAQGGQAVTVMVELADQPAAATDCA